MNKWMMGGLTVATVIGAAVWFAKPRSSQEVSPGVRSAPPPLAAASGEPAHSTTEVSLQIVEPSTAMFLIDAPLEKIKGRSTKLRGVVVLDTTDLARSHGQIDVDLDDLKTETFGKKDKDETQTEHAHNWLELGAEAKERDAFRWARFTFKELHLVRPATLADAPEDGGGRILEVVANGDLWLHGVTSPKTVKLAVTVHGPVEAPTGARITTTEPMRISLREHDVKPRDLAGTFLSGALERVGKKIDDIVQISVDVTARGASGSATASSPAP